MAATGRRRPHRAVLDDLLRLGLVVEQHGSVELAATGFVPSQDLQTLLAFLGNNAGDHLQAAVDNTLGRKPAMLERTVYADGLTLEACERIQDLARKRRETLHHTLVDDLTAGIAQSAPAGDHRIRIGIYVHDTPEVDEHATQPQP